MSLLKSIPDVPQAIPFFERLKEAVESFLAGKGQIFPVWAQEGTALADATYEWALGDGTAAGQTSGLVLAVGCELFAMSLNIDAGMATVEIVKNGQVMNDYSVTVPNGGDSYREFGTVLKFSKGDRINFRTKVTSGTSGPCCVCAWLRTR